MNVFLGDQDRAWKVGRSFSFEVSSTLTKFALHQAVQPSPRIHRSLESHTTRVLRLLRHLFLMQDLSATAPYELSRFARLVQMLCWGER